MLTKDQFADNHFIRTIIEDDLKTGAHAAIHTRFPPEPNGYLHIGHAKSICLNFGLAYIFDGQCNLRFDDTNPEKESDEYVNSIKEDVEWLGFHWAGEPRFASNYFDLLFYYAVELIKDGKAYVDDLTPEEMREYRGTLTEAGKNSPYRERSVEENLDLFYQMRDGAFSDGSKTLRLKIDMASGNVNMRDPVIYRIRRAHHHNTGDKWCIYPMYDYTHCISDAIEGITHSLCTLEFEAHRPLYDWVLENTIAVSGEKKEKNISFLFKEFEKFEELLNSVENNLFKVQDILELICIKYFIEINELHIYPQYITQKYPYFYKYIHKKQGNYPSLFKYKFASRISSSEKSDIIFEFRKVFLDIQKFLKNEAEINNEKLIIPHQYEFSRLELLYSITSKRKLNQLVTEKHVSGWDDPRMPTISGMRRRGYTPEGLRLFAKRAGISKSENVVDMSVLEGAIREELEHAAPRLMAVLNPLKVTLTNYQAGVTQSRTAAFHPNHPEFGERDVPIGATIYIEQDDFAEVPPKGWKRLTLGGEVRLRHSYVMRCDEVVKDENGKIVELKCTIDHDTLGKNPEGRKVKGVIHWVSAEHATPITVRLYDRLFTVERPDAVRGDDGEYLPFTDFLNPDSVREITAYAESAVNDLPPESHWQFERIGYFVTDRYDHKTGQQPVFNRTVGLKDTWQAKA